MEIHPNIRMDQISISTPTKTSVSSTNTETLDNSTSTETPLASKFRWHRQWRLHYGARKRVASRQTTVNLPQQEDPDEIMGKKTQMVQIPCSVDIRSGHPSDWGGSPDSYP